VCDDLAARDLRLVGHDLVELLVADPTADELRRRVALLTCLEETDRGEGAAAGVYEVVAAEAGQLLELRHEGLVDFRGELGRERLIDAVIAANGRKHVVPFVRQSEGLPVR